VRIGRPTTDLHGIEIAWLADRGLPTRVLAHQPHGDHDGDSRLDVVDRTRLSSSGTAAHVSAAQVDKCSSRPPARDEKQYLESQASAKVPVVAVVPVSHITFPSRNPFHGARRTPVRHVPA